MKAIRAIILGALTLLLAGAAQAVIIIDGTTTGRYNAGLGDQSGLDGAGGVLVGPGEGDPTIGPIFVDPIVAAFPAAFGADWLGGDYSGVGSAWSGPGTAIPASWTVGDETAIVYDFTLGAASDLDIDLGVDNGILVWLDGTFLLGATAGGGAFAGEYGIDLAGVSAGSHSLQILRADHGGATGYIISVDATPSTVLVPAPTPAALLGLALLGLAATRSRRSA